MVTTVVGNLKDGVTPFDAVSQAFPPGTSLTIFARVLHSGSDDMQSLDGQDP